MKYLLILSIFFNLISNICFTQTWQIDWQQCYGGSENDFATDIIQIEGGYFIAGHTSSTDGDVSNNDGGGEGWLVNIDSLSSIIWEKTYGGTEGERFVRVLKNLNNDYYLIGSSSSSDGDISYDPYPNSTDFWIVKIDSTGNIIWDRIVGGYGGDFIINAILTPDDGVIAIGYSNSNDGDITTHYGQYDMWMIKLNSNGETEWDFTIGSSGLDFPGAVIQTADGGYLVGGSSEIQGGGNLTCQTNGLADAVIIKLDSLRNIEWQHCYGGSDYDGITGLLEIEYGYIFAAYVQSNDGDISGWHGEHDIWIVQIDLWGNIIWQKCLGGTRSEFSENILLSDNGGYTITGYTASHNGDVTGNHSLNPFDHDIWMVKLTEDGEIEWQQCFGSERNEKIYNGVLYKGDNNYVLAGQTDDLSGDVQCNLHGWQDDYWVFEISIPDTTTITNVLNERGFVVYPNPARKYVVFEFSPPLVPPQGGKSPFIKLTTVFGQEVTSLLIKSEKTVWDTRKIMSGVYFYTFAVNGITESGKIIINK